MGPLFEKDKTGGWVFICSLTMQSDPTISIFLIFQLCRRLVAKSCPTLCDPLDCSPPGFSAHGFSRQETGVGSHSLLQEIFPGIEHMSPTLQVDSFPFDPPEKHSEIINS